MTLKHTKENHEWYDMGYARGLKDSGRDISFVDKFYLSKLMTEVLQDRINIILAYNVLITVLILIMVV